jgi:hypothetical protein
MTIVVTPTGPANSRSLEDGTSKMFRKYIIQLLEVVPTTKRDTQTCGFRHRVWIVSPDSILTGNRQTNCIDELQNNNNQT